MLPKKKVKRPPLTFELFLVYKREWKRIHRGFNPEFFFCSPTDWNRLVHELAAKSGKFKKDPDGKVIVTGVIVMPSREVAEGDYQFRKDKYDYVR